MSLQTHVNFFYASLIAIMRIRLIFFLSCNLVTQDPLPTLEQLFLIFVVKTKHIACENQWIPMHQVAHLCWYKIDSVNSYRHTKNTNLKSKYSRPAPYNCPFCAKTDVQ